MDINNNNIITIHLGCPFIQSRIFLIKALLGKTIWEQPSE